MPTLNYYYCPKCSRITARNDTAKLIRIRCEDSGEMTNLTRISGAEEAARKLSEVFLGEQFDLESYSPGERERLRSAFEQGAVVMYNCTDKV